jgi:hypothetical protein
MLIGSFSGRRIKLLWMAVTSEIAIWKSSRAMSPVQKLLSAQLNVDLPIRIMVDPENSK